MSNDPRQQRHRFPPQLWPAVFKAVVAFGQVANLVSKLLSMNG